MRIDINIANAIDRYLSEENMTAAEFARKMGISSSALVKWRRPVHLEPDAFPFPALAPREPERPFFLGACRAFPALRVPLVQMPHPFRRLFLFRGHRCLFRFFWLYYL